MPLPNNQTVSVPYADWFTAQPSSGAIILPAPNLYQNTFESGLPNSPELNTFNFNFQNSGVILATGLVTDLDGGTTGGRVYTSTGVQDPPIEVADRNWIARE